MKQQSSFRIELRNARGPVSIDDIQSHLNCLIYYQPVLASPAIPIAHLAKKMVTASRSLAKSRNSSGCHADGLTITAASVHSSAMDELSVTLEHEFQGETIRKAKVLLSRVTPAPASARRHRFQAAPAFA